METFLFAGFFFLMGFVTCGWVLTEERAMYSRQREMAKLEMQADALFKVAKRKINKVV